FSYILKQLLLQFLYSYSISIIFFFFFFFNDTATTEIYTLSLHDALPIYARASGITQTVGVKLTLIKSFRFKEWRAQGDDFRTFRSEEHTSELQSRENLVCRLLLEKKKKKINNNINKKKKIN